MTDDTQDADYARLPLAAAQPGRTSMATGSLAQRSSVASERLLGTLVHRLIQRVGLTFDSDSDNILEGLRQLVRPDEQPPDQNLDVVLARAVELYRNLTTRPEVRRLYEMGDAFHEVPFTFMQNGARSRGSIDCVIARLDGIDDERGLTILEFKTGLARSEHDEQVTVYKEALRQIFPGLRVTAVIVYPERLVVV